MVFLKCTSSKGSLLLAVAAIGLCATTAVGQSARDICRPASVTPLASEPPAKNVIDLPPDEPLASRGVVVSHLYSEDLHILPVFGPNALAVSPRLRHLHVTVDDASWRWANASANPIFLTGFAPGPHKVPIDLRNANRHTLDRGIVTFVLPEKFADWEQPKLFSEDVRAGFRSLR